MIAWINWVYTVRKFIVHCSFNFLLSFSIFFLTTAFLLRAWIHERMSENNSIHYSALYNIHFHNVRQYYNIALYIRFNIMILCTYMEMSCHLLLLSESVFINTQQEIFCYLLANCLGYCTEFLYALVIVNCVIRVSTCTHIEYCRLTHEYKLCIKIVKLFN